MFIQVIRGTATDPQAVERQFRRWNDDVRPGAEGFLGSTGGVTADGELVVLARFDSEDAARHNSERAEQGAWWEETSQHLDDPQFTDSADVDLQLGGGDDSAGFVQIMQGRTSDRSKLQQAEEQFLARLPENRPEVLGMVRAWHPDGQSFTQAVYFRSEAEAREGEQKEPPAEVADELETWNELLADMQYFDLTKPILF